MESNPVEGSMARPKSSSRLRELASPQPLPWVHSSPRWIVPVTALVRNDPPPSVERARSTTHRALPVALGLPIFLESLLLPARSVPYQATSTRPARPPVTVG